MLNVECFQDKTQTLNTQHAIFNIQVIFNGQLSIDESSDTQPEHSCLHRLRVAACATATALAHAVGRARHCLVSFWRKRLAKQAVASQVGGDAGRLHYRLKSLLPKIW